MVKRFMPLFSYMVVVLLWLSTVVAKYKYNGLILGLDYGLYHPDGTLYTMRSLDWSGLTENQSAQIVSTWYNQYAYKFNETQPSDFYYSVHPKWPEYYPRILYPLLSIPFVKLLGIPGMLMIPSLSLLVVMLVVYFLGVRFNQKTLSYILVVLLSGSSTVTRWMMSNTTDALLVGLFSLTVLLLISKKTNYVWFVGITLLVISTGLTRMSLLFWIGISIVLFYNKVYLKSLYIIVLAFIIFIPTLLSNANNSFLPVEGGNFLERFVLLPKYFFKISYYEFAQLFILDRILFLGIVIAIFVALKGLSDISNQYFVSLLIMGLLTGSINGTVGVNFRYQLPVITFACWVLIENSNLYLKKYRKNSI
jgi:hypothetical protein